jgi:pimeloyl-ACP methyl ester carboxylesterase
VPLARNGDIELFYDTLGDPDDVPLLLVTGQGSQLLLWPDELCQGFVDRGFFVVRFDNRDAGLSTWLPAGSSYTLSDMAADAVAVLDAVGLEEAHVAGQSLGGMIAQTLAIEHPHRVRSLTSISSMTGNFEFGMPTDEVFAVLAQQPVLDDDAALLDQQVAQRRVWASPDWFVEEEARAFFAAGLRRARPNGPGSARQLDAILASGSRDEALRTLDVPTLVVHGELDPLITPAGGRRTAELVPGAGLLMVERMAHDLPVQVWAQIIAAVTELAAGTYQQ